MRDGDDGSKGCGERLWRKVKIGKKSSPEYSEGNQKACMNEWW